MDMATLSDVELLDQVLVRNEAAWCELLRRFRSPIFACIRKSGGAISDADADDIFGRLCVELLIDNCRKLRAWDHARGLKLSSWLGMLAMHAAADYFRRGRMLQAEEEALELEDEELVDVRDPLAALLEREDRATFELQLAQLSDKERSVIRLRLGGRSTHEIAAELGVPESTVHTRWWKLQRKLEKKRGRA